MALSEIKIANRALAKLGEAPITSFSERDASAGALGEMFSAVRDDLLRKYAWSFAIRRALLPQLDDPVAFGFKRAYLLPFDCLRVFSVGRFAANDGLWTVEGGRILTDLPPPLRLRYVARVEDAALFDVSFAEALAARLACELCDTISSSAGKKQTLLALYQRALDEALAANAIEFASTPLADGDFVMARY